MPNMQAVPDLLQHIAKDEGYGKEARWAAKVREIMHDN